MVPLRECQDRSEWQALFEDCADQPLAQSWEYGQAMTALGGQVRRFVWGQTIAQVLERRGLRLVNRGPLGPDAGQMLGRLTRHAGLTLATPERPLAGLGLIPLITPRHLALWPITGDETALRAGLTDKWRNRLLRAEERGLRITQGGRKAVGTLLDHETRLRQARGYRALPGAFVRAWPGESLMLEWREGGQM